MRSILAALALAIMSACATPVAESAHFGETKKTAIEVCRPQGERSYLTRLACPDGTQATFRRIGNFGWRNDLPNGGGAVSGTGFEKLPPGVLDWHIVDGYEVVCGTTKHTLILDMYHCDQPPPDIAPEGFTIKPTSSP